MACRSVGLSGRVPLTIPEISWQFDSHPLIRSKAFSNPGTASKSFSAHSSGAWLCRMGFSWRVLVFRYAIFSWTVISFLILFRKDNTVQNGRMRAPFILLSDELYQVKSYRLT